MILTYRNTYTMGQAEIIEYLKEARRPVSRNELAMGLNEKPNKITDRLTTLLIHKEIQCIEISRKEAMKLYRCKRRMRLYYLP